MVDRWQAGQTVDVTIEDTAGGSRLTLVHSGLSDFELPIVTGGWSFGLDQLGERAPAVAPKAR